MRDDDDQATCIGELTEKEKKDVAEIALMLRDEIDAQIIREIMAMAPEAKAKKKNKPK